MKRLIIAAILTAMMTTSCYAETAHDRAWSYLMSEQETPKKIGDYLYNGSTNKPQLLLTTAYCSGDTGCRGDKMRTGYCAFSKEHYGAAVSLYQAIQTDEGYQIGEFIGFMEVRDCGYGKETGVGTSEIRPDRNSRGTIESSLCIDAFYPTLDECKQWMAKTGGVVFAVIVPNVKG